jgi:hypothetical protein
MSTKDSTAAGEARARPGGWRRWRRLLRATHRDVGYALVGLTFVYAISGLAVNHIEDWEPNYTEFERTVRLDTPVPEDDVAAVAALKSRLEIDADPIDVFRTDDELEVLFDGRELIVDLQDQTVLDRGRESRFFLRVANWLHLNRGKKAWTLVADSYAVLLLFLATSGMFMLPGKRGLRGRGALFVALGVAIPVLYVVLSGGPSAG